jgi:hypothetical protein
MFVSTTQNGRATAVQGVVLIDQATGQPYTAGGGGGGGSGADRELVVSTYRVKTAFTGASGGDTITATQVIDVSGTPSTVVTIWRNQTTAADLASAPSAANLELTGSTALTDAQLRAADVGVKPGMTSAGHLSATTAATGANWTAFASQACKQLTVSNRTGTDLEFRQGGAGVAFPVFAGSYYTFFGLTNANQLDVRRVDTSNTQVTVTARWEA